MCLFSFAIVTPITNLEDCVILVALQEDVAGCCEEDKFEMHHMLNGSNLCGTLVMFMLFGWVVLSPPRGIFNVNTLSQGRDQK